MFNLSKLSPSITDMIRMDHTHVMLSFHQYTAGAKPRVKKDRLGELGARMTRRRVQLAAPKAGTLIASNVMGFSGSTTALLLAAAGGLVAGRYLSARTG